MSIRNDDRKEISLSVNHLNNKKEIRVFIIQTWLKENPATKYRYFVETLSDQKRIYLERPARLNKGCDFQIFVDNHWKYKNGNDKPPSHKKLFELIENIKKTEETQSLFDLLTKVYHCESTFNHNLSIKLELCLKLAKWFFIEQDVTYWNFNGRNMLYKEIQKLWKN